MSTTRSGVGRWHDERASPRSVDFEGTNPDDSDAESGSIVSSAHTKLKYDIRQLSPTLVDRAVSGLNGDFSLGHCSIFNPSQSSEYFAFQIFETVNVSVRIGAPESEYSQPTCYCTGATEGSQPCPHTFWLLDRLARHALPEEQKSEPIILANNGFPADYTNIHKCILDASPRIFEELGCELRSDAGAHDTTSTLTRRIEDVRDIMAALSTSSTEDYHSGIFDELLAASSPIEAELFPRNLERTLAHSLIANDAIFRHFRALLPTSHCAQDYFCKKKDAIKSIFASLDAYLTTRPRSRNATTANAVHDIPWCASTLTTAVSQITTRLNSARTPLSLAARQEAAHALVLTLRALTTRNTDVYATPLWARSREQALPLRDRNIFVRFFGEAPTPGQDRFVLDPLEDLGDAVRPFVGMLEDIAQRFEENKSPKGWVDGLKRMVVGLKKGAQPGLLGSGTAVGVKRPGGRGGVERRESKRMK